MKKRRSISQARRWLVVTALIATAGCSREDRTESSEASPATAPPRLEVPAAPPTGADSGEKADAATESRRFPLELREAHRMADEAKTREDKDAARRKLQDAFESAPQTEATAELRQDVAARTARLLLESGSASEARTIAQRGLAVGSGPSVTRANLLVVMADAEEMLERPDEARKHLMEALEMNQALLSKELENP
jgi:hypothetical protein